MAQNDVYEQIMGMLRDVQRRDVVLPPDFNARKYWADHVGFNLSPAAVMSDGQIGEAIRAAITATNSLAGGGAAGYIALIRIIMAGMREDYEHADELVATDLMRQSASR